jgi:hypothetical protein
MAFAIEITKTFPPTRERIVLLEMLRVVRELQLEDIDAVICGGWVPFLKELARRHGTNHSMSLDIDLLLRAEAQKRENIDRLKYLLANKLGYLRSREADFRYEKYIDENLVELELLVDLPRDRKDEAVVKLYGVSTSLDVCRVDGANLMGEHVETIQITSRDDDREETVHVRIPDAVGFLLLKTTVCKYRRENKDPYDIYYYCRYSEDRDVIRQKLSQSNHEEGVGALISDLEMMFGDVDYLWLEMALDHMNLRGEEREREAQFIVRTIKSITRDL